MFLLSLYTARETFMPCFLSLFFSLFLFLLVNFCLTTIYEKLFFWFCARTCFYLKIMSIYLQKLKTDICNEQKGERMSKSSSPFHCLLASFLFSLKFLFWLSPDARLWCALENKINKQEIARCGDILSNDLLLNLSKNSSHLES